MLVVSSIEQPRDLSTLMYSAHAVGDHSQCRVRLTMQTKEQFVGVTTTLYFTNGNYYSRLTDGIRH